MRAITYVTTVVLVALTAACSGGGDGATTDAADATGAADATAAPDPGPAAAEAEEPTADVPDPCSLLSTADLAEATGLSFGEGVYNENLSGDGRAICDWISEDPFANAQTLVFVNGDYEGNRASAAEVSGEPLEVEVTGATRAYQTPEGSIVAMEIGDLFVQVAYIPPGPGSVNAATLTLAEKVAGRI